VDAPAHSLETILQQLGQHLDRVFHVRVGRVEFFVEGQQDPVFRLPLPAPEPVPRFVPNALQEAILEALDGRALRTDGLAERVDVSRSQLFIKPTGGLHELREHGLIDNHPRLGYYRPSAPPPELSRPEPGD
jgi:hypothetical protein